MSRICTRVLLAVVASLSFASVAQAETVTVQNGSSFAIFQFFLSPMDADEWGPDQLRDGVIESGGAFELSGIGCDDYDVKLVDEDGDVCIVAAPDICGEDQTWIIEDDGLLACQGFGE